MIRSKKGLRVGLVAYLMGFRAISHLIPKQCHGLADAEAFSTMKDILPPQHFMVVLKKLGMKPVSKSDVCLIDQKTFVHNPFIRDQTNPSNTHLNLGQSQYKGVVLFQSKSVKGVYINNPYLWEDFDVPVYFFVPVFDLIKDNNEPDDTAQLPASYLPKIAADDVTMLALEGQKRMASDVHLHAVPSGYHIWFRIQGQLVFYKKVMDPSLKQQIKFKSHMDISVYNMPQDGHFSASTHTGKIIDVRVASYPTAAGENFVFRLFFRSVPFQLEGLGFLPRILPNIQQVLRQSSGLILVTGPTGSGKTTTLYTFLTWMQQNNNQHFMSIEDPVESNIEGVHQSQIHKGFGFFDALKAMLRQDPDVIMVGEIRDQQTAKMVVEAAYTGHLVFSTLHTSDCWSAISRLKSFGIDTFLINHCLKAIVSQRLLQVPCSCEQGCANCNYSLVLSRQAIHDVLILDRTSINYSEAWTQKAAFDEHFFHSFDADMAEKLIG